MRALCLPSHLPSECSGLVLHPLPLDPAYPQCRVTGFRPLDNRMLDDARFASQAESSVCYNLVEVVTNLGGPFPYEEMIFALVSRL